MGLNIYKMPNMATIPLSAWLTPTKMTRIGTHLLTPKKMTRETTENLVNSRFYIRPPITDLVLLESQLSGEEKKIKREKKNKWDTWLLLLLLLLLCLFSKTRKMDGVVDETVSYKTLAAATLLPSDRVRIPPYMLPLGMELHCEAHIFKVDVIASKAILNFFFFLQ